MPSDARTCVLCTHVCVSVNMWVYLCVRMCVHVCICMCVYDVYTMCECVCVCGVLTCVCRMCMFLLANRRRHEECGSLGESTRAARIYMHRGDKKKKKKTGCYIITTPFYRARCVRRRRSESRILRANLFVYNNVKLYITPLTIRAIHTRTQNVTSYVVDFFSSSKSPLIPKLRTNYNLSA